MKFKRISFILVIIAKQILKVIFSHRQKEYVDVFNPANIKNNKQLKEFIK